jgi:hypothetical protein
MGPLKEKLSARRYLSACIVAIALSTGCAQSPEAVYVNMTTAAQMGDREAFLDGFTSRSRPLVESLISLSEAYGLMDSNPYQLLVFDEVEEVVIEEERAILTVRRRTKTRQILMIKESCEGIATADCDEGQWRIDHEALEAFWDGEGKS